MNALKKLLIIDDDVDIQMFIKIKMKHHNFTVISADCGMEGIEKAMQEKPDIIFFDFNMPDMNGWEVCTRLKEEENTKNIPSILLTASITEELSKEALSRGAAGSLKKPFNEKELLVTINEVLGENKKAEISNNKATDVWKKIQSDFLNRVEIKIGNINNALSKDPVDYESIRMDSHSLKGSAGTIGFNKLGAAAGKIMEYIDKKDEGIIQDKVEKLVVELKEIYLKEK